MMCVRCGETLAEPRLYSTAMAEEHRLRDAILHARTCDWR
jgi:hypothetical protein